MREFSSSDLIFHQWGEDLKSQDSRRDSLGRLNWGREMPWAKKSTSCLLKVFLPGPQLIRLWSYGCLPKSKPHCLLKTSEKSCLGLGCKIPRAAFTKSDGEHSSQQKRVGDGGEGRDTVLACWLLFFLHKLVQGAAASRVFTLLSFLSQRCAEALWGGEMNGGSLSCLQIYLLL